MKVVFEGTFVSATDITGLVLMKHYQGVTGHFGTSSAEVGANILCLFIKQISFKCLTLWLWLRESAEAVGVNTFLSVQVGFTPKGSSLCYKPPPRLVWIGLEVIYRISRAQQKQVEAETPRQVSELTEIFFVCRWSRCFSFWPFNTNENTTSTFAYFGMISSWK